ncbi:hypothetical protein GQ42DRAFT_165675, partial [Ramicandelaber brevisporus]
MQSQSLLEPHQQIAWTGSPVYPPIVPKAAQTPVAVFLFFTGFILAAVFSVKPNNGLSQIPQHLGLAALSSLALGFSAVYTLMAFGL